MYIYRTLQFFIQMLCIWVNVKMPFQYLWTLLLSRNETLTKNLNVWTFFLTKNINHHKKQKNCDGSTINHHKLLFAMPCLWQLCEGFEPLLIFFVTVSRFFVMISIITKIHLYCSVRSLTKNNRFFYTYLQSYCAE